MIHPRLVHACTDPALLAALAKVAKAQQLKAYLGVDPTARSLHVGHLVGVQAMRQLQQLGFGSVGLVGGATALIGDPSFRDKAREPLSADACAANAARLGAQLQDLLGRECVMVDNAEWFREMSAVDLLRDVGSHFKVHAMLSRDAVKARREGLNFTELAYQMLQAYDFSVLHARLGVRVQVGGSDQWGNIVGGVELIHRLHASSASSPREPPRAQLQPLADAAVGLTVPLVTVG
jgi:tyrosyl-tRNA synthetase